MCWNEQLNMEINLFTNLDGQSKIGSYCGPYHTIPLLKKDWYGRI
jgi:hypothetical protein